MPLTTKSTMPSGADDVLRLPGSFPVVPESIRVRFADEAVKWDRDISQWWRRTVSAFNDFGRSNADVTNATATDQTALRKQFGIFTAAIEEEIDIVVGPTGALARKIVTVSALAGSATNIKVQSTPPGSPALNDLWVDNSTPALPITYQWDGANWAEVIVPVSVAAVSEERTARVTADGFLEGKYSLTVVAGNVVTGMNITSASGPGTDISSVIFRATDFQIYNGVSGIVMFNVSGSTVQLAQTLTVSTAGKVYIGTGTYANTNTAWYVDSSGNFSLKDRLTWNATTNVLSITGDVVIQTTNSIITTGDFLNSDSTSFLTWQGPTVGGSGLYLQRQSGGAVKLSMLAVGVTSNAILQYRSRGTYGALSSCIADDQLGVHSWVPYTAGAWGNQTTMRVGVTTNCSVAGAETPYWLVTHSVSPTKYLVWNYDGKLYFASGLGPHSFNGGPTYMSDPNANLYLSATNTIKTDGDFFVGGNIRFGSYTATPSATIGFITILDNGGTVRKLAIIS